MPALSKLAFPTWYAYGSEEYRQSALFSILSFLFQVNGEDWRHRMVIYTDEPKWFRSIFRGWAEIEPLPEPWPENPHRQKLNLLEQTMKEFGPLVLLSEADTYFRQSPLNLLQAAEAGKLVLNDDQSTATRGKAAGRGGAALS